ncbi:hypothetical protein [Amycolatopsis thermoflava]
MAGGTWLFLLPLFLGLNVLVVRKSSVDKRVYSPLAVGMLIAPYVVWIA